MGNLLTIKSHPHVIGQYCSQQEEHNLYDMKIRTIYNAMYKDTLRKMYVILVKTNVTGI